MKSIAAIATMAAVALTAAGAGAAPNDPARLAMTSQPAPLAHHSEMSRARSGGILVFSLSYGAALSIPVSRGFSERRPWLAVPVAGPMVAIGRGVGPSWGLVMSEIGQLLGVGLLAAGPSVTWHSTALSVSPWASETAQGLCTTGVF